MTRSRFLIGMLLLTLLSPVAAGAASSASSSSAPSTLYTRIKQEVEKENTKGSFDDDVVTFLRLALTKRWPLTDDQIHDALNNDTSKACNDATGTNPPINDGTCPEMMKTVQDMAKREQDIRSLGRILTSVVNGYELPLSDLPNQRAHLSTDLLGILNLWSAGTGNAQSKNGSPAIRSVTIDEAILRPKVSAVADQLKKLSPEQRTAAIWQLRSGAALIMNTRAPDFPAPTLPGADATGTERQYLQKQWPDLNNALIDLLKAAQGVTIDPPLSDKETAYVIFSDKLLKELMPDNTAVWVRLDGNKKATFADAGLDWGIPLDPVLPSLKKYNVDEAILGGTFPPEPMITVGPNTGKPWNGMQLCTSPLAMRGYLCRPYTSATPDARCPIQTDATNDTITLAHCTVTSDPNKSMLQWCSDKQVRGTCKPLDPDACTKGGGTACGTLEQCQKIWNCTPNPPTANPVWCCLKKSNNQCAIATSATECVQRGGSTSVDEKGCVLNGCAAPVPPDIRYTTAGADVCREIDWKKPEAFDPNTQCTLNLHCEDDCGDQSKGLERVMKDASGKVDVCIGNNEPNATYQAFHELSHAYQICSLPPGSIYEPIPPRIPDQQRLDILNRDSEQCCETEGEAFRLQCAMQERDGVFAKTTVPIDAQSCAEVLTDSTCKGTQVDGQNLLGCFKSKNYDGLFVAQLIQAIAQNPKKVAARCVDAINPQKMDPRVKALKDEVEHRDDVCSPTTVTDYTNRIGNNLCFIGQCAEQSLELHRITAGRSPADTQDGVAPWNDPITGTPLGNLLSNPPLAQYRFPAYRPQLLVHTLDAALCESAGLPALMPPVLCSAEALRQLSQARIFGFETAVGLANENSEQNINLKDLMDLSRGIGVRTGTEMYGEYLRESSRSFAEVIGMAANLLNQLKNINFPTQMCPVGPGLPPPAGSSASSATS